MTEAFIRDVIEMFRKYGKVEVRTKVGGNLARLILGKMKGLASSHTDVTVSHAGGSVTVETKGGASGAMAGGVGAFKGHRDPASIPFEEIEIILRNALDEGVDEGELCRQLGLPLDRPALMAALEPFHKRKLVKGPKRSGRVRWTGPKAPLKPPLRSLPGRKR